MCQTSCCCVLPTTRTLQTVALLCERDHHYWPIVPLEGLFEIKRAHVPKGHDSVAAMESSDEIELGGDGPSDIDVSGDEDSDPTGGDEAFMADDDDAPELVDDKSDDNDDDGGETDESCRSEEDSGSDCEVDLRQGADPARPPSFKQGGKRKGNNASRGRRTSKASKRAPSAAAPPRHSVEPETYTAPPAPDAATQEPFAAEESAQDAEDEIKMDLMGLLDLIADTRQKAQAIRHIRRIQSGVRLLFGSTAL